MKYTDNEIAQEQWRDIDGYNGMYQVSDLGRVRSHKSGGWEVMKQQKQNKGYLRVGLVKDKNLKLFLVHRLVANAFIPNTDESKTLINHINEIKTDNRASNLEWCTARYNSTYNDINRRRRQYPQPVRNKVMRLYNPSLTYEQNIELFRANGIECTKQTLWRLRKDLGLTKKTIKSKNFLYLCCVNHLQIVRN